MRQVIELFAFVAEDDDGRVGILCRFDGRNNSPMIALSPGILEAMRAEAMVIGHQRGLRITAVRFVQAELMK